MSPRTRRIGWLPLLALLPMAGLCQFGQSQERAKQQPTRALTNSVGMQLVYVPPGKFQMGTPKAEQDAAIAEQERAMRGGWKGHEERNEAISMYRAEGPQHDVEITRGFYLGVHEVTQKQYRAVMGRNPSFFSADGEGGENVKGLDTSDFPVEQVRWQDAAKFCEKLSALAAEKKAGRKYRLPTEAEWEHACRAGSRDYQATSHGRSLSSSQANFNGNHPFGGAAKGPFLRRPCKVGSYEKNAFGLYDVHGNVWEWCADWYDKGYYKASPARDPSGPAKGRERVVRGGCWVGLGAFCRSGCRGRVEPAAHAPLIGFRVALVVPE